ncbi:MAG: hypothetical protein HKO64_12480, partial [Xanthomonadales bacterium]|nr:hypothetical protein [Xanthomonadales bacterium]
MSRWIRLALLLLCCPAFAQDEATNTETDFLNFANGALPVALGGDAEALRVGQEHALEVVDGNPAPFLVTRKPAGADQRVSFTYQLPALTTFTRFGIPNIGETPSPSQTFFRHFNISVSRESPVAGFVHLLSGELETHADKDDV